MMYKVIFGIVSWSTMGCRAKLLGCSDLLYVRDYTVYECYLVTARITPMQTVFKDYIARTHAQTVWYGTVPYGMVP